MNTDIPEQRIDLDDLTSLHVTGSDATKFLHAQFTNDLANLQQNAWQYSGYCTAKGRLLSFMIIARTGDNDYLLILPEEISEGIMSRLRMFVMRDDVTLTPQDKDWHITGIIGSSDELRASNLVIADNTSELAITDNAYLLTLDSKTGRYLYLASRDKTDPLQLPPADRKEWSRLDILNGIPAVYAATQEAFVPQMVNLDLIGAVNFKKGCYPGQEVVARVHYLGKIKQRMFIATTKSKMETKPGDKVFIAGKPESPAGTLVQSAETDSGLLLQVVLKNTAVEENADFRLGSAEGDKLQITEQPYPVLENDRPD